MVMHDAARLCGARQVSVRLGVPWSGSVVQADCAVRFKMKSAIICLGANGDICNALPIAFQLYQEGNRVSFVVSTEYAGILDGVSYATPIVFGGHYSKPLDALKEVEGRFDQIAIAQCYGTSFDRECSNFCEEVWRLVGLHELWDTLPLVFDRRDAKRETELFYNVLGAPPTVPLLLVSHGGNSSPFAKHQELMELLEPLREDFQIVDISNIRAERFYDLLGLYERAAGLISTDSGCLHLAQATPALNVIAIVTDTPDPWYGSPIRSNHSLRVGYSEFEQRKHEIVQTLNSLLSGILKPKTHVNCSHTPPLDLDNPPSVVDQTPWPCGIFDFSKSSPASAPGIDFFNCGFVHHQNIDWLVARRSVWQADIPYGLNDIVAFKLVDRVPIVGFPIVIQQQERKEHFEDPRIFAYGDRLLLSCCNFVGWGSGAHQLLVLLDANWQFLARYDVPVGRNGPGVLMNSGSEKNWLWFFHQGKLHLIYMTFPHTIMRFNELLQVEETYTTQPQNMQWPWGQPRGGTPPVRIGNEYWSFFHSAIEHRKFTRRYFMGAYAFEAQPPFNITRISTWPLLAGSEKDRHGGGKPLVCFANGSCLRNGKWFVTFGINDLGSGWIDIPHEELKQTMVTL